MVAGHRRGGGAAGAAISAVDAAIIVRRTGHRPTEVVASATISTVVNVVAISIIGVVVATRCAGRRLSGVDTVVDDEMRVTRLVESTNSAPVVAGEGDDGAMSMPPHAQARAIEQPGLQQWTSRVHTGVAPRTSVGNERAHVRKALDVPLQVPDSGCRRGCSGDEGGRSCVASRGLSGSRSGGSSQLRGSSGSGRSLSRGGSDDSAGRTRSPDAHRLEALRLPDGASHGDAEAVRLLGGGCNSDRREARSARRRRRTCCHRDVGGSTGPLHVVQSVPVQRTLRHLVGERVRDEMQLSCGVEGAHRADEILPARRPPDLELRAGCKAIAKGVVILASSGLSEAAAVRRRLRLPNPALCARTSPRGQLRNPAIVA